MSSYITNTHDIYGVATPTSNSNVTTGRVINSTLTGTIAQPENIIVKTIILDGKDLNVVLAKIQERLLIIEPDFEKMDRYPALRDAYDQYKTIEALLKNA